ncbi:hypothetical protein AB0395_15900 [Streptosporangium sp. NPDC051023]|uniref:hypothetical protein n=1 Tax=Streptosporangium sp. NPDC051023 TaxID=3155410 RepID=UPI00344DB6AE
MLPLAIAVVLTAVAALRWSGEVHPHRIVLFARRQALTVTPGGEPVVRHYLRLTRMWRSAGLVAGVFFPYVPSVPFSDLPFFADVMPPPGLWLLYTMPLDPFSGWFLGVLGAEPALGSRRSPGPGAAVTGGPPRLISPPATCFLYGGLALSGVSVLSWLGVALSGRPAPDLVWSVAGAAVSAGSLLLIRSLRSRPIPVAAADVVEAVLATRSRSAHVLATGSAVFVLSWCRPNVLLPDWGDLLMTPLTMALWIGAFLVGTQPWAITVGTPPPSSPPSPPAPPAADPDASPQTDAEAGEAAPTRP